MSVTIPTKDIGDVKEKKCDNHSWNIEEGNEDYIRRQLHIK